MKTVLFPQNGDNDANNVDSLLLFLLCCIYPADTVIFRISAGFIVYLQDIAVICPNSSDIPVFVQNNHELP